jgi:suppressor for copper-sensitivity B
MSNLEISGARVACKRGTFAVALRSVTLACLLAAALAPPAFAASASPWFETDQGRIRLIAAEPGLGGRDVATIGLQFQLAPHWHIYWRSPGDAGYPPHLDWKGSANFAGAKIAWPAPQRFSVLGLETVGYVGAVVLPITVKADDPAKTLSLRAHLSYLTCEKICIPYETDLALELPPGPGPADAAGYAALIAQYQARVPGDGVKDGLKLAGATVELGARPALVLRVEASPRLSDPDAFVEGAAGVVFGAPRVAPGASPGESVLRLPAEGAKPAIDALPGAKLMVTLTDGARAMETQATPLAAKPGTDWAGLLPVLLLALGGGFTLNFMPCVLPVLSLKLLAAVTHRERGRLAVRAGFLATAAGIVASFLALAGVALGFRMAGVYVGWGLQFQQPLFLVAMVAILALFAANLWGWFDVPLPRAVAALGESHAQLGGFFAGVLATLLATPCTAPLLGTALGIAFVAPPGETVAIFAAMGAGLALPYLAVAAFPEVALKLPRPGGWIRELRAALGAALALSAVWLLWVLTAEIGEAGALTVTGLVLAAMAALALLRPSVLRRGAVVLALAASLAVPFFGIAPWLHPELSGPWRAFHEAAIAPLVAEGDVVLVDVTADWCLTCKVNEKIALDDAEVRARLGAAGTVAMRADWTRSDPVIARYLREFGRYGIPFNAVYGPGAPRGIALPEILTPRAVLDALDSARSPRPAPGPVGASRG